MKLTKQARRQLGDVLRNLERTQAYLDRPTTYVCKESNLSSADHLTREPYDSLRVVPITKEYGSDLVGLKVAIEYLGHFLATH